MVEKYALINLLNNLTKTTWEIDHRGYLDYTGEAYFEGEPIETPVSYLNIGWLYLKLSVKHREFLEEEIEKLKKLTVSDEQKKKLLKELNRKRPGWVINDKLELFHQRYGREELDKAFNEVPPPVKEKLIELLDPSWLNEGILIINWTNVVKFYEIMIE